MDVDFIAVTNTITITIRAKRISLDIIYLFAIRQTVVVGIRIIRVCAVNLNLMIVR